MDSSPLAKDSSNLEERETTESPTRVTDSRLAKSSFLSCSEIWRDRVESASVVLMAEVLTSTSIAISLRESFVSRLQFSARARQMHTAWKLEETLVSFRSHDLSEIATDSW